MDGRAGENHVDGITCLSTPLKCQSVESTRGQIFVLPIIPADTRAYEDDFVSSVSSPNFICYRDANNSPNYIPRIESTPIHARGESIFPPFLGLRIRRGREEKVSNADTLRATLPQLTRANVIN